MSQANISFRAEKNKVASLDKIAQALDRDRSYVLNEAISAYLEIYRWQTEHIREGVKQADHGEFASEEEVKRIFGNSR
ncbi:MAG: ribbon-helix-helix protein, CopG family [Deltaproteobacteria bacterium]|nr:ribbon-helix-helix protein, CopG family [Deltaproteobacteria bacterium]